MYSVVVPTATEDRSRRASPRNEVCQHKRNSLLVGLRTEDVSTESGESVQDCFVVLSVSHGSCHVLVTFS